MIPKLPDITTRLGHRHRNGVGMDINPTKRILDASDQLLSFAALRRWFYLLAT